MSPEMIKALGAIQAKLNAPKNQTNKFGGYDYRSCEDVLQAVKPLLAETHAVLRLNDELVLIGDRYYVKATATIDVNGESVSATAYAREADAKKGMEPGHGGHEQLRAEIRAERPFLHRRQQGCRYR